MFGFSLPKLLFTAIVIAAVVYGFRWLAQVQQNNEQRDRKRASPRKTGGSAASSPRQSASSVDADDVETMIECRVCGSYVSASGARSCGRDDCPYPG